MLVVHSTPESRGTSMSVPKPRIKPKADPCRERAESPDRDAPPHGAWDPPAFTELDGDAEQKADEAVLYYEDDCLR
jgi:hypothetical protein